MRAGFAANCAVQAGNPHLSYTIVNGKAVTKKAPNRGVAVPAAFSPRSEVMVRRNWGPELLLSDALSDSARAFCVSYGFFSRIRFITSLTMGST